jgi:hypothetical protein
VEAKGEAAEFLSETTLGVSVAKKRKRAKASKKGGGRRFQSGSEDLEQLKGVEEAQKRSRKARRKLEQSESGEPPPSETPLIHRIDKSRKRIRNRLDQIKDYDDAIREFES